MSNRVLAAIGLVAGLLLAGCASEDWETKYNNESKARLDDAATIDQLKQDRAEAIAKNEQAAQQIRALDVEAQKRQQAYDAAMKQNESMRQSPAASKSAPAPSGAGGFDAKALQEAVAQLKAELGNQAPNIEITKEGNVEITLKSDVTFAAGSADLSESGKKSLKSLSSLLKGKFAPYQVRVEGHTDATPLVKTKPKYQDNFGLGSARSLSVVRFMETDLGIEPTRLMSASRGEHEPVADNKSDAGKKQNRRVSIVVVVPHDSAVSMAK